MILPDEGVMSKIDPFANAAVAVCFRLIKMQKAMHP